MSQLQPSRILIANEITRSYCGSQPWAKDAVVYHKSIDWKDFDIFINQSEYDPYICEVINEARANLVPSLHIADGIIEWRNNWEHPPRSYDRIGAPIWQPVLSDKIACIGAAQLRTLATWSNSRKVELVGIPRLTASIEHYLSNAYEEQSQQAVLITTAKQPYFQQGDFIAVIQALQDIKTYLEAKQITAKWRLPDELSNHLNLTPIERQSGQGTLAQVLASVGAVITTPSTLILEAMLYRKPVLRLDYTNAPQYVRTAWNITAQEHISKEIDSALIHDKRRLSFQDEALHDACYIEAANSRLTLLVQRMVDQRIIAQKTGKLQLDESLMPVPESFGFASFTLRVLHQNHGDYAMEGEDRLRAENAQLRNLLIQERTAFEAHIRYFEQPPASFLRRVLRLFANQKPTNSLVHWRRH